MVSPDSPLIVQGDSSVLLEVQNPQYVAARDLLARFAELEKSPEYLHTYRITPLSLWNASSAGHKPDEVIDGLTALSKYPMPANVARDIREHMGRYGRLKLVADGDGLLLVSHDLPLLVELSRRKEVRALLAPSGLEAIDRGEPVPGLPVSDGMRGALKQALVRAGFPAEDLAGYAPGQSLALAIRQQTVGGRPFSLRHYQAEARDIFHAGGSHQGGSGTIVLPCGAGKTVVGMAVMEALQCNTLILTPNTVAVRQWIAELLDKTTLTADDVGEYSGLTKVIRPVTVSTYQMLTHRGRGEVHWPHFALFDARDWGLVIYDEVHLLPAPVFRATADLQAKRRLGLTATLVREDGLESDVFSLIGPKRYDVPWKDLERQGWIAVAHCREIRIPMDEALRMDYAVTPDRLKHAFAAANPRKLPVLMEILARHPGARVLIMGTYLDQLETIAETLRIPLITGKTPVRERERLLGDFRGGATDALVISKVGNFSIDLPDANVAIEVSGTFGSRQEEAQRLGRILRPKEDGSAAFFYTLVTRDSVEQQFAANRQRFLTEQGYSYEICYESEVLV